jgi:hypothetical protein
MITSDPGSPSEGPFWHIAVNLSALILLGFAICAWILYYTDFFPEVLDLLGLGGIFAWIAFLANVLRKERKEELQKKFETHVLQPMYTWVILLIAAVLLFMWASCRGAVVISTKHDDKDRTIEIRLLDQQQDGSVKNLVEENLPARSQRKYALPTSLFRVREYRVKISGLPATVADVKAWRKKPLSVPGDFDAPLVLIHLSEVLRESLQGSSVGGILSVYGDRKSIGTIPTYHGENVWVGGDKDIEIPERILSRWRLDLIKNQAPQEILTRWPPSVSINPNMGISENQIVDVSLIMPSQIKLSKSITVTPPYPLEVTFDEHDAIQPQAIQSP